MPVAHTNADDIPSRRRRLFRMGVIHSNDHTSLLFVWCLFILCIVLVTGCASNEYVTVRKVPRNPLTTSLNLLSRTGPKLTPRTTQLLRRFDLPGQDKFSVEALEKLQAEIRIEPTPDKMHACAEMAYVGGKRAETAGRKAEALDLYGTAVAHAYWYLFDPLHDELRNPYDPLFRGACELYNTSLESALRLVQAQGRLRPGMTYTIKTSKQQIDFQVVVRGPWHNEDFDDLKFVSEYEINGLSNWHQTFGLGVPLIAVRKAHAHPDVGEQYYPPGLSFGVTAFLRVAQPMDQLRSQVSPGQVVAPVTHHCVLELHDPLEYTEVDVRNRRAPLETDISTPLAFLLDNETFKEDQGNATAGLFRPNTAKKGLFMLEPYDPNRIPVLMVHGLWSSPTTWMEMFNDLRAFPEIRQRYQFWFYLYQSGEPFWVSASKLRKDLTVMRQTLDPNGQSSALDRMVLVGHSMGGLVSRLQTLDSGDRFWRVVSDKPFPELKAEPATKEQLAQTLFFRPNPSVRRIITIGTPHRGSEFANDYTRWIGRKFIHLPAMMVQLTQRVVLENPGYFRDAELLTITTGIDSLAPDSPILPVLADSPRAPWVKHHNIVGLTSDEGFFSSLAKDGDGVVSQASAHLDDVDSEIVVAADHVNVHRHPRSILEVRRILLEHEQQYLAELGADPYANYANQPRAPMLVPRR